MYGFLVYKNYETRLAGYDFYADWQQTHFGPFSRELQEDITSCVDYGYIEESITRDDLASVRHYILTPIGASDYRRISSDLPVMKDIRKMLLPRQKSGLITLLREIYDEYPGI